MQERDKTEEASSTPVKTIKVTVKPLPQGNPVSLVVNTGDTVKDIKFKTGFDPKLPLKLLYLGTLQLCIFLPISIFLFFKRQGTGRL